MTPPGDTRAGYPAGNKKPAGVYLTGRCLIEEEVQPSPRPLTFRPEYGDVSHEGNGDNPLKKMYRFGAAAGREPPGRSSHVREKVVQFKVILEKNGAGASCKNAGHPEWFRDPVLPPCCMRYPDCTVEVGPVPGRNKDRANTSLCLYRHANHLAIINHF